ncbi:aminoglycoside phosphotransferase (APT) family kinase protein [Povalibacter uvarum]|uniref:Aminoglycoside phosphotransferase (APT) family kinase protein n=1 Tax=Povalibacter uvarum TaxID=732238 RepID=A0A841HRK5_9GAMM|nr:phosphotransferase family protein [Povalibacter uvarum]MBB6095393.1 aminoglycoside phosphotransferase (APT) family kinase protein [Povalibacter uvarum]
MTTIAAPQPMRHRIETVPQHWRQLEEYLASRGMQLRLDTDPQQFAGGFANLNYLIHIDGKPAVLRRPPRGPWPPGAYDMGREFRILSRLWERFPLAPRGLHLCEDARVIGVPFQIVEYRAGISVRDSLPEPFCRDAAVAQRLGETLVDLLAELHRVDVAAIGLENLGKPNGFLVRAAEGWIKRASLAVEGWASAGTQQLIIELAHWLREHQIESHGAVLLHNDFKLDNVLLDPQSLRPLAVLDWDQGTRGDGLYDLAILLSYWTERNDPPAMHQMAQMPTAQPGFPSREQAALRYARALGRDLSDFRFHRVLAQLRTAVIFQQLHARWRSGETQDPRYAAFAELGEGLLEFAVSIARGQVF